MRVLPQGEGETPSARRETVFERGAERHALDRRRQVHDLPAHRARRARALRGDLGTARRSIARRRRCPARPIPRSRRRAAAARVPVAAGPPPRGTSRASTAARRSSVLAPARDDPSLLEPLAPGAPEVAAEVRWARDAGVGADRRRRARAPHDARRARAAARRRGSASRSSCDERRATSPRSTRARRAAAACSSTSAGAPSRAPSTSTGRSRRARAGSSTTRDEILAALARLPRARRSRRPARARPTSPRSASPTSARRSSCGSARAGGRSRTPSSGRTPAAPSASPRSARSTASAPRRACRSRPTSPAPSSRGCSTSCPGARARAEAGELAAGTIDSWLAWHLAGVHVTDATNASRTLLMDLRHARLGRRAAGRDRRPARAAAPRSCRRAASSARSAASRSPRCSATSRPRSSGSAASRPARPSARTARATSSCSTRASAAVPSSHGLITGVAYRLGDAAARRTCSRAPSPSRARSCSGCATTSA